MFKHIPIGSAGPLTEREDFLPIDFVLANHRLRTAAMGFDVNGSDPPGIFLEDDYGVSTAVHTIARVQLHDDVAAGVAEEEVPGSNAADGFEIVGVGVITDRHAV